MPIRTKALSPIRRLHAGLRCNRFVREESGATIIEFALLSVPFFAIVGAILETAVIFLSSQVLDSAVHDASRLVRTGQAQAASFDEEDFRAAICDRLFGLFNCEELRVRVAPIDNFASATVTPPVENDCAERCNWTLDEAFRAGEGASTMMVQAYYKWPIVLGFGGFDQTRLADGTKLMGSVRVFRNEPF